MLTATGRGKVRRMRFRKWMNCCTRGIRISWTRICRSTLTRFPHSELMQCVAPRIVDRDVLDLFNLCLKIAYQVRRVRQHLLLDYENSGVLLPSMRAGWESVAAGK